MRKKRAHSPKEDTNIGPDDFSSSPCILLKRNRKTNLRRSTTLPGWWGRQLRVSVPKATGPEESKHSSYLMYFTSFPAPKLLKCFCAKLWLCFAFTLATHLKESTTGMVGQRKFLWGSPTSGWGSGHSASPSTTSPLPLMSAKGAATSLGNQKCFSKCCWWVNITLPQRNTTIHHIEILLHALLSHQTQCQEPRIWLKSLVKIFLKCQSLFPFQEDTFPHLLQSFQTCFKPNFSPVWSPNQFLYILVNISIMQKSGRQTNSSLFLTN